MEKQPKKEIAKSVGKIVLVLAVCFLFLQMGKISVTNAILRDQASAKNNSFVAGTWGDSLGLKSTDAVIEEALELGVLTEEDVARERALDAALENAPPIAETPAVVVDAPESDEAPIDPKDTDAQTVGDAEGLAESDETASGE